MFVEHCRINKFYVRLMFCNFVKSRKGLYVNFYIETNKISLNSEDFLIHIKVFPDKKKKRH